MKPSRRTHFRKCGQGARKGDGLRELARRRLWTVWTFDDLHVDEARNICRTALARGDTWLTDEDVWGCPDRVLASPSPFHSFARPRGSVACSRQSSDFRRGEARIRASFTETELAACA